VSYARSHALTHTGHYCARAIAAAIRAGGLKIEGANAKDFWRSLEKDILPSIENVPVQDIKARLLIQVLEPIKARGALETVRRLVQRINEIMIYSVNTGLIDANPASGIGNAFE
ncbi:phage integrase central domain-containing protein, partial [Klebsiella aerogenes]|uniref:phage integrase central domain-containing protein n=1 Tax=Klebsiella aerogenes TaxID=548 RepID=UPI003C6DA0C5